MRQIDIIEAHFGERVAREDTYQMCTLTKSDGTREPKGAQIDRFEYI